MSTDTRWTRPGPRRGPTTNATAPTGLACRLCKQPLRDGDEAVQFDVERRIEVKGDRARWFDVSVYEHADGCPTGPVGRGETGGDEEEQ